MEPLKRVLIVSDHATGAIWRVEEGDPAFRQNLIWSGCWNQLDYQEALARLDRGESIETPFMSRRLEAACSTT